MGLRMKNKAYFGIKFYEDNRNKDLIDSLVARLRSEGLELICMASDVEKWGAVRLSAKELMCRTFEEIDKSDLVILEMSEKGVGLGIEAGYAVAKGKPVIVFISERQELSGTMQGIADTVITYNHPQDISIPSRFKPASLINSGSMKRSEKKIDDLRAPKVYPATKLTVAETAAKYHVEDLENAHIFGSRLNNILKEFELSRPISNYAQEFLRTKGLWALLSLARKEISFTEFSKVAEPEQAARKRLAKEKFHQEQIDLKRNQEAFLAKQKLEEEALFAKIKADREKAAAAKRAFDNDPKNIAKAKQLKLRHKYGFYDFAEKANFQRIVDILNRVDSGERLSKEDVVWLSTTGDENYHDYFTDELQEGYHRNEAEFHANEFKKKKDYWSAVSASKHYRKCYDAETAESMLATIDVARVKDIKVRSAICTTHGGVKRDLGKRSEALDLGNQAHLLTPKNFRPCTLLGAVNMEMGNHTLGHFWYDRGVERGYSEKAMDDDLRSIFMHAEKVEQDALRVHLLKTDPVRYSWANKMPTKKPNSKR